MIVGTLYINPSMYKGRQTVGTLYMNIFMYKDIDDSWNFVYMNPSMYKDIGR